MKNLANYIKEMHENDPECIPLALGICLMLGIAFFAFGCIIISIS